MPGWRDVKARLQELDGAGPLALIQDQNAACKDNNILFHFRFATEEDVLKPYK